jgi:putative transposase
VPDTKADIVLHFVWGTKNRHPWIEAGSRHDLHNCLAGQVTALHCRTLAVGGTDDHVQMLVAMRTDVSAAKLAQQVKGISSHFCKDRLGWNCFYWQEGYGVFSVSRSHVKRVIGYIERQVEHHAAGRLWQTCEEVLDPDDEVVAG